MKSYDFEYDGLCLSEMGYIICKFGSDGLQTISNGSQITFNTVSIQKGSKFEISSIEYSEYLETTIQICKNNCLSNEDLEISVSECRDLMSWLNREEFHKLKILSDDYLDLYFEASFNISRIEMDGVLCGLELHVITNRPFALREPRRVVIKNTIENGIKSIYDISDKEGYIYPYVEITINQDGDLKIHNDLENRDTYIKNCVRGEVITMDYPIISSSLESHSIQNDFNWNFLRIANTFKNKQNRFTISLPCTIVIKYTPIVKTGF